MAQATLSCRCAAIHLVVACRQARRMRVRLEASAVPHLAAGSRPRPTEFPPRRRGDHRSSALALPLGELSPQVTERASPAAHWAAPQSASQTAPLTQGSQVSLLGAACFPKPPLCKGRWFSRSENRRGCQVSTAPPAGSRPRPTEFPPRRRGDHRSPALALPLGELSPQVTERASPAAALPPGPQKIFRKMKIPLALSR